MAEGLKNKFLCVHGHFYQPPRENPWTGLVDPEESAHPYRDWNERIFAECYAPNGASPVPDARGLYADMADNYRRISFNFGTTLLSWLEAEHPELHAALLDADAQSLKERGHGNAIAQPYYHAILPLQTLKDKRLLVRWGLQDFRARFDRPSEGIWLPETAVDEETLEVLVEEGLRYTVLSPDQAARVRDLGAGPEDWKEVTDRNLNPTRPYRWVSKKSPGKHIAVFFYHKLLSRAVETGEALESPEALVKKVMARYFPNDSTQLVTIANDGEFYGHHHRRGHEALGGALRLFEEEGGTLVNFAQFLDQFPPPQEVEIRPRTAWSCDHGLGRWLEDCGCRSKSHPDWKQGWRGPLRAALDGLSAGAEALYEREAGNYFRDYRAALPAYGRALARGPEARPAFLAAHALPALAPEEAHKALALLELQRERLAMYTSCGWFFDDISGLEAGLCLVHASRAADIAASFGQDLETALKAALAAAPSNIERSQDGRKVYETMVGPRRVTLPRAAAHFALLEHLGLGWGAEPRGSLRAAVLSSPSAKRQGPAGRDKTVSLVRLELEDLRTTQKTEALVVILQKERLDLACWVSLGAGEAGLAEDLEDAFSREGGDFASAVSQRLGQAAFGLDALFPEERREVLRLLTPFPFKTRERERFFFEWRECLSALRKGEDPGELAWRLIEEAPRLHLRPDQLPWAFELRALVLRLLRALPASADPASLSQALRWVEVCERTGVAVDLWELRLMLWRWRGELLKGGGPAVSREACRALGEKLGFSEAALRPLTATEARAT